MSFPDDPRDLKLSLAFGHNDAEDPTGVTFVQVSPNPDDEDDPGPVLGTITLTRGRIGDAPLVDATQIEFALRDTDGDYSPRNVSGAHYGELLNGTPIQVAVDVGAGDQVLGTAFVPEWNPAWRGPDIDDKVPIGAEGVLAKLGRDAEVKSALQRSLSGAATSPEIISYWPMEDDTGGTAFASGLPNGAAMAVTSADFAAEAAPVGSLPLPAFTASTAIDAVVSGSFPNNVWAVDWLAKFAQAPAAPTTLLEVEVVDGGSVVRWVLATDGTDLTLIGYDSGGSAVFTATGTGSGAQWFDHPDDWSQIRVLINGASGFISASSLRVDTNLIDNVFQSVVAVTAGSVTRVSAPASAQLNGLSIGHLVVTNVFSGQVVGAYVEASVGWASEAEPESAAERIQRLCLEADVPVEVTAGDTPLMGAQAPGTLLGLLRECEAVDHGVLYELRDGRLAYQPRAARYNATVALTLNYGTEADPGDISTLRQFDDNRDVRNRVKVTRTGGSSVTVEKADGPVGSDAIGVRPLPVTLNLYGDDQLAAHAGWLLYAGTIDKPRYIIVLDLRANQALRSSVFAMDSPSRIVVTGAPVKHVGPDDLDLIVEGERMTLDAAEWLVAWWCEPFDPWNVGEYAADDVTAAELPSRYDTADAVNSEEFLTGTDSTLRIETGGTGPLWTETGPFPFDVVVRGCRLSVSDIDAAGTGVADAFGRTESNGWGTADTGQEWTNVGGSASDYSVGSGVGVHSLGSVNTSRRTLLGVDLADFDITVTCTCPAVALTADIHVASMARYQDGSNYYMLEPQFEPSNVLTLALYKQVVGVFTGLHILDPFPPHPTYSAGETVRFRFRGIGEHLLGKMWLPGSESEPNVWHVQATDSDFTDGDIGLRSNLSAGNTNTLPVDITYDNLVMSRSQALTISAATPEGVTIPARQSVNVRDRGYFAL